MRTDVGAARELVRERQSVRSIGDSKSASSGKCVARQRRARYSRQAGCSRATSSAAAIARCSARQARRAPPAQSQAPDAPIAMPSSPWSRSEALAVRPNRGCTTSAAAAIAVAAAAASSADRPGPRARMRGTRENSAVSSANSG